MEYIGILSKSKDMAGKWRVQVNLGDNKNIVFKFQEDPSEEQVIIQTNQYINDYNMANVEIEKDPYFGMTTDQRISKKCEEKLRAYGITSELMGAVMINKLAKESGLTDATYIDAEFIQLIQLLDGIKTAVYAEENIPRPE